MSKLVASETIYEKGGGVEKAGRISFREKMDLFIICFLKEFKYAMCLSNSTSTAG